MNKIIAYTDGSAVLKYPYKGGFGIVILSNKKIYKIRKGFCNTKTGRMELYAVLTCLRTIQTKKSILTIYSDSMYVVNTCNEWIDRWEMENFLDKKNVDLLKQLIVELRKFKYRPKLVHIKGHQEIENKHQKYNDIADKLADYRTHKDYQVDLPLEELNLTIIEKEDFKKINEKLYFKPK